MRHADRPRPARCVDQGRGGNGGYCRFAVPAMLQGHSRQTAPRDGARTIAVICTNDGKGLQRA